MTFQKPMINRKFLLILFLIMTGSFFVSTHKTSASVCDFKINPTWTTGSFSDSCIDYYGADSVTYAYSGSFSFGVAYAPPSGASWGFLGCIIDPSGVGTICASASNPTLGTNYTLYCANKACSYGETRVWSTNASIFGSAGVSPGCVTDCSTPPPPSSSFVNLNFIVKDNCDLGWPISGATVNIDQDFGNGTNRTTDGSGFANFGVYQNTSIDWTVSKSGYNPANGNVNSGSGTTVNVTLTGGCGGGPSCPRLKCDSSNSCVLMADDCNSSGQPYPNQCSSNADCALPPPPPGEEPSVNISCNPSSIPYNTSANVGWSSSNVSSCTVSPGGWSGTSGFQSTGNLTSTTTYTVTCNP